VQHQLWEHVQNHLLWMRKALKHHRSTARFVQKSSKLETMFVNRKIQNVPTCFIKNAALNGSFCDANVLAVDDHSCAHQPANQKCTAGQPPQAASCVDCNFVCVCVCSALFEWDMCIQLQLTDVCTPDSCGGTSNTFKNFNQDVFCSGTDYLLDDFLAWMTSKRDAAQIGSDSLVHLFTGFKPLGANAIGCAWKGTVSS